MKDILFDLDGTITDPMLGITKSVAYALKHFEIEVRDLRDLIPFIGPPLLDSFQEFYHFNKEQANEAVVKYREYFKETGIFENEPYQGIETMLKSLVEKGYRLSIATSKPHVFASRILEHFNLMPYFSNVYGSELDGTRNAKGEVIAYALNDLKCDPKKTIMVGDRKHDVIGAHENDLKCIGVLYGYGSLEEFDSCHSDYVVDSVEALYELLISLD